MDVRGTLQADGNGGLETVGGLVVVRGWRAIFVGKRSEVGISIATEMGGEE